MSDDVEGITDPLPLPDRTAYERLRERFEYRAYLDLIAESAVDYVPSSPATRRVFAEVQNLIYRAVVGMTAYELRTSGREIVVRSGKGSPTKQDRKVAKNYLSEQELRKMQRLVVLLRARADLVSGDGHPLTLDKWVEIVRAEVAVEIPVSSGGAPRRSSGVRQGPASPEVSDSAFESTPRRNMVKPSKPVQPPRPGARFSSRARRTRRRE